MRQQTDPKFNRVMVKPLHLLFIRSVVSFSWSGHFRHKNRPSLLSVSNDLDGRQDESSPMAFSYDSSVKSFPPITVTNLQGWCFFFFSPEPENSLHLIDLTLLTPGPFGLFGALPGVAGIPRSFRTLQSGIPWYTDDAIRHPHPGPVGGIDW